jgi:type VI secretion system protein ImpH
MRHQTNPVTRPLNDQASAKRHERLQELFVALEKEPFKHDFYQTMRVIEALQPQQKRLGESLRPVEDAIRLGQEPSMAFAPAAMTRFTPATEQGKPRLDVRFFGFLGPNGPLPLHLTEFAAQRALHHGDTTFARFLDTFLHRLLSLFYRAWAQASPTVSLDRPKQDRFAGHVGALAGYGMPELLGKDAVPDAARQYFTGLLSRNVRHADGIAAILKSFFRMPARVEPFIGHWMRLQDRDRTRLGMRGPAAQLGGGATLGATIWDRQHKVRVVLGPMSYSQYVDLLPSGTAGKVLHSWLVSYFGHEMVCDVQLILAHTEVPETSPGVGGRLGWTSWCGARRAATDAQDLILNSHRYAVAQDDNAVFA